MNDSRLAKMSSEIELCMAGRHRWWQYGVCNVSQWVEIHEWNNDLLAKAMRQQYTKQ